MKLQLTGKAVAFGVVVLIVVSAVTGVVAGLGKGPKPLTTDHRVSEDELLVKFAPKLGVADVELFARAKGASRIDRLGKGEKRGRLSQWYVLKLNPGTDRQRAEKELASDASVLAVQPNYALYLDAAPNDPDFDKLWGLHNTGQPSLSIQLPGRIDADIDAPEAWELPAAGTTVLVAVTDTGVDYTHPDLAANIWNNPGEIAGDNQDNDDNGYIDDVYGYDFADADANPMDSGSHGTHVAGTIAAVYNNGVGVSGVAREARLMVLKTFGDDGVAWSSDSVTAINYAIQNGAKVINASWGSYSYNPALEDAIRDASDAGVVFVASAGNDNNNNDIRKHYPDGYDLPNVIGVVASDRFDARAGFSNYGVATNHLGAPGSEIYSTTPANTYEYKNGTSMAAPHVSGAVAVILANNPSLTPAGVRALLMGKADSQSAMATTTQSGGRLNLNNALTCNDTDAPYVQVQTPANNFVVYQAEPTAIRIAVSRCGHAIAGATAQVTFGNGDAPLTLLDDGAHADDAAGDGVYGAVWQPGALGTLASTFTVTPPASSAQVFARSGEVKQRIRYRHESIPFSWIDASPGQAHALADNGSVTLPIGFDFEFYGIARSSITISANGFLSFDAAGVPGPENTAIPNPALPNTLIAPFWDDFNLAAGGAVYSLLQGVAPNRRFTVSWVGVSRTDAPSAASFQATLHEGSSDIEFHYQDTDLGHTNYNKGRQASVGVEDDDGLDGTPYAVNQAIVESGSARRFYPVPGGREITYRVNVELTALRGTAGSLTMDFIDGDGANNNQVKVLEYASDGSMTLSPLLTGDASGSFTPGPGRIGDGQFFNEISQATVYGSTLSFLLKVSTEGSFASTPDAYSLFLLDVNGMPYATDDPSGANALAAIDVTDTQPAPLTFGSQYASVTIQVVGAPVANVGGPYTGFKNEPISFDGSASYDPEDMPINYAWDFGDGNTGTGAQPSHAYSAAGTYDVTLVVDDGELHSTVSRTTVTVAPNHLPVANAGADQHVYGVKSVTLNGSGSSDQDGTITSNNWVQTAGTAVTLGSANSAIASFISPTVTSATTLNFRLTVTDDYGDSASDTVDIVVHAEDADEDSDGMRDEWEISYFGSTSAVPTGDVDGDGLSNLQEYQEETNPIVADPAPVAISTLQAAAGDKVVTLSWSNVLRAARYDLYWATTAGVTTATGTKIANVSSPYQHTGRTNGVSYYYVIVAANNSGDSPASNEAIGTPGLPPVANTGGPYTVQANTVMTFNGAASYDPEGKSLTYQWDFGDGSTGAGVSPQHTYVANGNYTATLTVHDGTLPSVPATTSVTVVTSLPPVADAGDSRPVMREIVVELDGSKSNDADGVITQFAWSQVSGPIVTLANANTARTAFIAPKVFTETDVTFKLVVTDDNGDTAQDTVTIRILVPGNNSDGDGLPDGWERFYFGDLSKTYYNDPDGDAIWNDREYEIGSNPTVSDPAPQMVKNVYLYPTDGKITATWDPVSGGKTYTLSCAETLEDLATIGGAYSGTETQATSSRNNGVQQYCMVKASNGNGGSPASEIVSAAANPLAWTTVHDAFSESSPAKVGIDVSGRLHALVASSTGVRLKSFSSKRGWWQDVSFAASGDNAQLAVAENGEAAAVWRSNNNLYGAYFDSVTEAWSSAVLLENFNGDSNSSGEVVDGSVNLAMNKSGRAVVVWTQKESRYFSSGGGWNSDAVYMANYYPRFGWLGRVSVDYTSANQAYYVGKSERPKVAISDNGNIGVVWQKTSCTTSSCNQNAVHGNATTWDGPMSGAQLVGDAPDVSVYDRAPAITFRGDSAIVAWGKAARSPTYMSREFPSSPVIGWRDPLTIGTLSSMPKAIYLTSAGNGGVLALVQPTDSSMALQYSLGSSGTWARFKASPVKQAMTGPIYAADDRVRILGSSGTATGVYEYSELSGWSTTISVPGSNHSDFATTQFGHKVVIENGGNIVEYIAVNSNGPNASVVTLPGSVTVGEGQSFTLDGSNAYDPDRDIVTYTWTQLSGAPLTISIGTKSIGSAKAPIVAAPSSAVVTLTVTDAAGHTSSSSMTVNILDTTPGGDTTPPTTNAVLTKSTKQGYVYYDITMNVSESATTFFRVTGGSHVISGGSDTTAWQTYSGPIKTKNDKGTTGLIEYYSVDGASNQEDTKSAVLQ